MKHFVYIIITILCLVSLFPSKVFADDAKLCDFVPSETRSQCDSCVNAKKAWTAFGCIDTTSTGGFTTTLFNLGIGMAGGIAFLLILFGGFQIMTSTGNPEKLQAGQELISASITGLLMIMFSAFLLKLIGVDILGLPEWK
jgi:hypothetical protein